MQKKLSITEIKRYLANRFLQECDDRCFKYNHCMTKKSICPKFYNKCMREIERRYGDENKKRTNRNDERFR